MKYLKVLESVCFILDTQDLYVSKGSVCELLFFMKVEQLFRLGLKPRSECLEVLERCGWNLEQASIQMLDSYSPSRNRYSICVDTGLLVYI